MPNTLKTKVKRLLTIALGIAMLSNCLIIQVQARTDLEISNNAILSTPGLKNPLPIASVAMRSELRAIRTILQVLKLLKKVILTFMEMRKDLRLIIYKDNGKATAIKIDSKKKAVLNTVTVDGKLTLLLPSQIMPAITTRRSGQ